MAKKGKIAWNERLGAAANARAHLPALVRDYFAEVRGVLASDPPPPELHAIRLASKKLRYSLELFRSCYGTGLKTRLEELQHLQDLLGDVNDCVAAERLLETSAPASPARDRASEFLRIRAAAKAAGVRQQWHKSFDAPGKEQWWRQYLAAKARAPKR